MFEGGRYGKHDDRVAAARQAARPHRRPHALSRPVRRPARLAVTSQDLRGDGESRFLADVREHRVGDCTTAAAGHMIEAWTAAVRGQAVVLTDEDVLDAFEHVKRVDPLTGEEGAIELEVLQYWRKHGIG